MYFIVNDKIEGNKLIQILESKLYVFLINICQWGNFRNEQKLFSYLKFQKITNVDITDDYINTYFKLSIKEINLLQHYFIIFNIHL